MICELCEREGLAKYFEFHHFFPVKTRRKDTSGINVCHQCGDAIHQNISNEDLQSFYHTTDRLKNALRTYINWVRDKPLETHFSTAGKKRKLK